MSNERAKTFYDKEMPEKFGADYEHERWHKTPIKRAGFFLTKTAIGRHLLANETLDPSRILELGPGAGTWTKLLVGRFPEAYIDLLDISTEMLARAKAALGASERLRFLEGDILEWSPEGKYDLFFSSRVLEYIDDKRAFAEKVSAALAPGGFGFLITKMPHYERERFFGKKTSEFHSGQIAPPALAEELRHAGFIDIGIFPVTVHIPLVNSALLDRAVGFALGKWPLGLFGMTIAESYCVVFRKPHHDR